MEESALEGSLGSAELGLRRSTGLGPPFQTHALLCPSKAGQYVGSGCSSCGGLWPQQGQSEALAVWLPCFSEQVPSVLPVPPCLQTPGPGCGVPINTVPLAVAVSRSHSRLLEEKGTRTLPLCRLRPHILQNRMSQRTHEDCAWCFIGDDNEVGQVHNGTCSLGHTLEPYGKGSQVDGCWGLSTMSCSRHLTLT